MKFHWVYLLLAGFLGLVAGRTVLPGRAAADGAAVEDREAARRTKVGERVAEVREAGPVGRLRQEIRRAAGPNLPGLVYRALEVADPVDRRMLLTDALRRANGTECVEIIEQFQKLTGSTGRDPNIEWEMALFETGKKAGAEAMDAWKAQGKSGGDRIMWHTLYGMAADNPQAAMAWLNAPKNADLNNRNDLVNAVLAGAALEKPEEAARLIAALPEEQREWCVGHFSWNAIQNGGLDGGIDWMLATKKQYAESDPAYAKAVEQEILDRIFKANQLGGALPEMADHLARIYESTPIEMTQLVSLAGRLNGTDGLELLSEMSVKSGSDPDGAPAQALQLLLGRMSPERKQVWLDAHPENSGGASED